MPSKHVIRNFAENQYYHIYNRGVEKRNIFLDQQDYHMFLYYLFIYVTPLEKVLGKYPRLPIRLYNKNLNEEVEVVAYCLMPNHFHFLLFQKTKNGISKLLKQITNGYTFYFNRKYKRVGSLVQGPFKAVLVETDELLLHISRYIHLNPLVGNLVNNIDEYQWSSYSDYIRKHGAITCSKDIILSHFSKRNGYEQFVLDQVDYARELEGIKNKAIDLEA